MRTPRRPRSTLVAAGALLAAGCRGAPAPDAYGNFEAVEVVVAAQTGGQLLRFIPLEGEVLARGEPVAQVDTTQLALQQRQVSEQSSAARARGLQSTEQVRVLEVQRDVARRAYERTRRLYDERAATAQQLDQAERDYRTLLAQIQAARAEQEGAARDAAAARAHTAQIADLIAKSRIVNPRTGTVLATYVRAGEVVQNGQPLYKVANLDTLELRAYVTGRQLSSVRLGEPATVHVEDDGKRLVALPGRVSWISATAEFTPTPVQTRDERADLVYAVKILVANPGGLLKIGMPGDVNFGATPAGRP